MAGSIYLNKFGGSKLQEAGDCFMRAKSYNCAASAYAEGKLFSHCLDACVRGKLYIEGLEYIPAWKKHAVVYGYIKRDMDAITNNKQKLLEGIAHDCHKRGDKIAMMEFVKDFISEDSIRSFLKTEGCYEELLELEIEWNNFVNAAKIAKRMGETMREVEMLEKAKHFEEASLVLISHILARSIWSSGSKGWPLKQFPGKKELLYRAKNLAAEVWRDFFELVCTENACLSDENVGLFECQRLFVKSVRVQSVGGQILSTWKILDIYFSVESSKYLWLGNMVVDTRMSKEKQVSVETLVFYWDRWKEKIGKILHYLGNLDHCDAYGKFCLNYMGVTVTKHFGSKNSIYLIHNSDAYWVKAIDDRHLHRQGKIVFCEGEQFARPAMCYWRSEMLSVGMKVLKIIGNLHELSSKISLPLHWQTVSRIIMYGVAKLLHEDLASSNFRAFVVLMDWREPLALYKVIRESQELKSVLEREFRKTISSTSDLTLLDIGNAIMAVESGSRKSFLEQYKRISESFDFGLELKHSSRARVSVVENFHIALRRSYYALSLDHDYMSPSHFTFLLERVLIVTFYLKGSFFSIKSTFLEWLVNEERNNNTIFQTEADWEREFTSKLEIIAAIVFELLSNKDDVVLWIENSKLSSDCHSLLVFRLFVTLCLICMNSRKFYDSLFELLRNTEISSRLPPEFYSIVSKLKPGNLNNEVGVLAKALASVGNPLVIASSGNYRFEPKTRDAIFIDLEARKDREVD